MNEIEKLIWAGAFSNAFWGKYNSLFIGQNNIDEEKLSKISCLEIADTALQIYRDSIKEED